MQEPFTREWFQSKRRVSRLFFFFGFFFYGLLHMMMRLRLAVLSSCMLMASSSWAAGEVLVEGGGIQIFREDVLADMQRLPVETRKAMLARPDSIASIATNLFQRRLLAADAERNGAAADLQVATQLRLAKDRVLSEARLDEIDRASQPPDAKLDALAAATYRAEPARFVVPEQVQARHLLISTTTPNARAQAEELLKQLQGGAKFEDLARRYSADKSNSERGGDLGWFSRGRMVPEFEAAAFALKNPGDLSGIVETKFGFHLIQLVGRQAARTKPFEDVREELRKEGASQSNRAAREQEVRRLMGLAKWNNEAIQALSAGQP